MSRALGRPENCLWDNSQSPLWLPAFSLQQKIEGPERRLNRYKKTNLFLYPIGFLMPGSNTLGHWLCAISCHCTLNAKGFYGLTLGCSMVVCWFINYTLSSLYAVNGSFWWFPLLYYISTSSCRQAFHWKRTLISLYVLGVVGAVLA